MAVNVNCPGCRTSYPVTEDLLGKKIRCKKCQETFTATAVKSPTKARTDERITTRQPAKGGGRYDEDEVDDAPRRNGNGRARPVGQRPTPKPGSNKGLLIGGAVGGALLLAVGIGVGVLILNKDDTPANDNPTPPVAINTPPISTGTPVAANTNPEATAPKPPDTGKPANDAKAGGSGTASMRTNVVPKVRPPRISPAVVKQREKSAVLIRVTNEQGIAEGSGWFAEPGIIVTNSHVVGMKDPGTPPPEKIEVILYSGDKENEDKKIGELLAIDREEDLAVIRVKGKNLPEPLTIVPSADLKIADKVYVMGFPLGSSIMGFAGLSKQTVVTVKVREAPISGRIINTDGSVKYIETEGGADHGNSGGAVLDTNGNVVAILVAGYGDVGSTLRFVIPSEYATHLLQGRITRIIPRQAVVSGAGITQPISVQICDPLKRIQKVSVDVWTGKPGKIRPAGTTPPRPIDGDGSRVTLDLPYDPNQSAPRGGAYDAALVGQVLIGGDMNLPPLPPNEVYWFQPHYVSKDGKDRWGEAVTVDMGRFPVEKKPANLAVRFKAGEEHSIELGSAAAFGFEFQGRGGHRILDLTAYLNEKIMSVKDGAAEARLKYTDLKMSDPDEDSMFRKALKGVMEQVKNVRVDVTLTKEGQLRAHEPDLAGVPAGPPRDVLRTFNNQIMESLEALSVHLPNKDVQPGESWDLDVNYTIDTGRQPQNTLFKTKYTYLGTRNRDGHEEAVLEMTGTIAQPTGDPNSRGGRATGGPASPPPAGGDNPDDGNKQPLRGLSFGAALVDLTTGQVSLARHMSEMAIEFPIGDRGKVRAAGTMDLTLKRTRGARPAKPASTAKADPKAPREPSVEELLPGLPKKYNPVVTADDSAATAEDTGVEPPLVPSAEGLPADVRQKVARASVLVQAVRGGEPTSCSGWFAGPNGIIVTNAAALGVREKSPRPPDSLTVIVDSGRPNQRKLPAKIVSVDRGEDLAVIKVDGPDLPDPLPVQPAAPLEAPDRLFDAGFAFGSDYSKIIQESLSHNLDKTLVNVSIRPTVVGGKIFNKDGTLRRVLIEGAADEGNLGGAVVDPKGNVRGVLAAQYGQSAHSTMCFFTPAEFAGRMLRGYPLEVIAERPYLAGSVTKLPVELKFADPLGRVSKVAVDYWVGSPGKQRLAADKLPKPEGDDGPRKSFDLTYDAAKQTATGEFVPPDLPPGRIIWLQPRFTDGTGKELWAATTTVTFDGPPLDRSQAVKLQPKFKAGSQREVELATQSDIQYSLFGQQARLGVPFKVSLTENVIGATRGVARIQLIYEKLELDLKKIFPQIQEAPPELEAALQERLRPLLSVIRGVITLVDVTKDGRMKPVPNGLSFAMVPAPLQEQMAKFNSQVFSSLQATTFPLPDRTLKYGDTWDFPTDLFLPTKTKSEQALFHMKFRYLGVRERGGRKEAVVAIAGSLTGKPADKDKPGDKGGDKAAARPSADNGAARAARQSASYQAIPAAGREGRKKGLYGDAHGIAYVDVEGGFVTEVQLAVDIEVELLVPDKASRQEVPVLASGRMDLLLRRHGR